MSTAAGDVFKELHSLQRNLDKLTDGQAQIEFLDEETKTEIETDADSEDEDVLISFGLTLTPNDGHYKGATVRFKVSVPSTYPGEPPNVECLNSIYHPNIDVLEEGSSGSSICVNLLAGDWEPGVGLDGCVIAVLFLLHNPNQDDALSHVFSGSSIDEEEFVANVRASLKGEEVEGLCFDVLVKDECAEEDNDTISDTTHAVSSVDDAMGEAKEAIDVNGAVSDSPEIDTPLLDSSLVKNTDLDLKNESVLPETDLPTCNSLQSDSIVKAEENDPQISPPAGELAQQTTADISPVVEKEPRQRKTYSYIRKTVAFCFHHLFKRLNRHYHLDRT
ncbi:nedd8-conjugating enzyme ubc12 [Plakobranchus ocellatus]|uniref:Nedd8-conjugating enzyme ubc12 n=1 Tax=Plakobranchus ocellatus TaxID=259542 RepID=A0AAV4CR85_9GAST|nr:nedd8-conjugating enzyme ubc12 [Plakobranchus ocellatus]